MTGLGEFMRDRKIILAIWGKLCYIWYLVKCDEWENPHGKHLQERDGHRLQADPGCAAVFARELPRGNARTGHLRYQILSARCLPRMWVVPRKFGFRPCSGMEALFLSQNNRNRRAHDLMPPRRGEVTPPCREARRFAGDHTGSPLRSEIGRVNNPETAGGAEPRPYTK